MAPTGIGQWHRWGLPKCNLIDTALITDASPYPTIWLLLEITIFTCLTQFKRFFKHHCLLIWNASLIFIPNIHVSGYSTTWLKHVYNAMFCYMTHLYWCVGIQRPPCCHHPGSSLDKGQTTVFVSCKNYIHVILRVFVTYLRSTGTYGTVLLLNLLQRCNLST